MADSPVAVVEQSEAIITCLLDADALEAVFSGDQGILAADVTGKLFVEMSTVQPKTQLALAERVTGKGGAYVECPVSGSTGPAREGRLIGLDDRKRQLDDRDAWCALGLERGDRERRSGRPRVLSAGAGEGLPC